MATGDIHTVLRGDGWVNISEDYDKLLSDPTTQAEAAAYGRWLARDLGVEHFLHRADGSISERFGYPWKRARDIPG